MAEQAKTLSGEVYICSDKVLSVPLVLLGILLTEREPIQTL